MVTRSNDRRPPTAATRQKRAVRAGFAVATLEYYDYFVFGLAAALVFNREFFPTISPTAGVLASFATFAVGFIARPIGGILAGHLGDRYGRKKALVVSLLVMGASTLLMALLPPYSVIGVLAPLLLTVLRVMQGLALGAQWGGAVLIATEHADPNRRGARGGIVQLAVPVSLVVSNTAFLVATVVLSEAQFLAWGWRLIFAVSALALALAWYIHRSIEETPASQNATASPTPRIPLIAILRSPSTVLLATASNIGGSAVFYVAFVGIIDYCTRIMGLPRREVLPLVLLAAALQLVVIPVASSLSDRVGRLRVYGLGLAWQLLWAFPMFLLVDTGRLVPIGVALAVMSAGYAIMSGPQAALFAELFDPTTRYTGASLGYQLANVLGGGIVPFLMILLPEITGTTLSIPGYLFLLGILALGALLILVRRTSKTSFRHVSATTTGENE